MKICTRCNSIQPDNAMKCANCGSRSIRDTAFNIKDLDEANLTRQSIDRKKKMIIALVILFALFLLLIGITIVKITMDAANGINNY